MTANRRNRIPVVARRARRGLTASLLILLVFGASMAFASVNAGRYAGSTSEHGTVTLKVASDGKRITKFNALLGYNGKCGQGGGPGLTAAPSSISIKGDGSFSQNVTLSLTGIATPIHDPGRVFGKVSGSRVTGTVEQFLRGKVNKCYIETFSARRK